MNAKVWRRGAAAIAAGVAALALLAVTAATVLAAPTKAVNGHLVVLGSTGAVRFQPQNTLSTGDQVAMLATAAAIIVVVGGVAWILDRQSRTRLAAVPGRSADDEWQTIGGRQEVAGSPNPGQDQKRKAA